MLGLADAARRGTGAYPLAAPAKDEAPRLSLDLPLARGAVASFGYSRLEESDAFEAHDVNNAAAAQFGRPNSTVGVSVKLRFK